MSERNLEIDPTDEHARCRAIVDDLLVQIGEGLESGDFSLSEPHFQLPQEAGPFASGTDPIETREDLRALFDGVRSHYGELGAERIIRPCIEASLHDENTIYATHVTFLLKGNVLVKKPYPVFSILRRTDGAWRFVYSVYATDEESDVPDWAYRLVGVDQS